VQAVLTKLGQPGHLMAFGPMKGRMYGETLVLGVYDGGKFQGTDRLAMNVQPYALAFLRNLHHLSGVRSVLFEGDRLMNLAFLRAAAKAHALGLFVLQASEAAKQLRHIARGDTQTDSWLKGRATKWANLCAQVAHTPLPHETAEDGARALAVVMGALDLTGRHQHQPSDVGSPSDQAGRRAG
jgi:hypothetical protein